MPDVSTRRHAGVTPLRRLLAAEVLSSAGTALSTVALPWFVLTTTGSATRAGLVLAAEVAPVVVFGFVSGTWAERVGVRRWMILSDLMRAPLFAAVPILYWLHELAFPVLLAIVFVAGCVRTPYETSQQILLAHVVGEDEVSLARASSSLQTARRLTLLIAPPVTGALIAALGAPALLLVDAVTYLLVVPLILGIDAPRHEAAVPGAVSPFAGVREVYADRLLGAWTTATVLGEAAGQSVFIAMPVLALVRYHSSATLVGVMLAAFGVGAVIGGLSARRLVARMTARRLAMWARATQALLFLALVPPLPAAGFVAVLVLLGLANGLTNGPVAAVTLTRLEPSVRTRGIAAISTLTWIGALGGLLAAGPALDAFPLHVVFLGMAVLQLLSAGLFLHGGRDRSDPASAGQLATADSSG